MFPASFVAGMSRQRLSGHVHVHTCLLRWCFVGPHITLPSIHPQVQPSCQAPAYACGALRSPTRKSVGGGSDMQIYRNSMFGGHTGCPVVSSKMSQSAEYHVASTISLLPSLRDDKLSYQSSIGGGAFASVISFQSFLQQ